MLDLEGPNTPADKDGCRYFSTCVCCLCHAAYLDIFQRCNSHEARRMFANGMFRNGRIPNFCVEETWKDGDLVECTGVLGELGKINGWVVRMVALVRPGEQFGGN